MTAGAEKKVAKSRKFQAVKGVRDLLPPETALWNRVEQTAHNVFATFGFAEIRLPIFEPTELFARSIGLDTDVVSKEMYTFIDNPNVAYLNAVRRELLQANLAVSNPDVRVVFINRLDEFVRTLQKLVEQGLVRLSSSSQSNFDLLRTKFNQFVAEDGRSSESALSVRNLLAVEIMERVALLQFGENVSLRPEGTASVCRAYIEHGLHALPQPVKLYYKGPMFRRERPQKGRYRQFYQIGAEVLGGSDAAAIDAELIEMAMIFLQRVGLEGAKLEINSIGHNSDFCRERYVVALRAALEEIRDQLGPDSRKRIETNPMRVLDSKVEGEQELIQRLPRLTDYICDDCRQHYDEVKRQLDLRGIEYQTNWRLVRGLDYYMRTTFEITAEGLGSQNAICGGGRYDGLVETLGGPSIKGIGFAIGEDRLILSLQSQGTTPVETPDVFIAWKDEGSADHAYTLAKLLREVGLAVQVPTKPMSPGDGLGLASKLGIPIGVVVGPSEVSAGVFAMKILSEGSQVQISSDWAARFGRLLLFRVLLEKTLVQLAKAFSVEHSRSAPLQLLSELTAQGVVPPELTPPVRRAILAFNQAAHGRPLSADEENEAVSMAIFVVDRLSRIHGAKVAQRQL